MSSSPQVKKRNVRGSTPSASPLKASRSAASEPRASQSPNPPAAPEDEGSLPGLIWNKLFYPAASFLLSVLQSALKLLRPLLVYALALWLLIGTGMILRNLITSSVSNALAPVCHIPGMSRIIPFCEYANHPQPGGPPEFDQLMTVQSAFEDVLSSSSESATLPMDMKRSELSIRDLRSVVSFSSLPSRNELVFEFGGFIDTARQASMDLTKFNSRIGRAVDHILSTNRWTLQVIDSISEREAARGSLTRFFADTVMAPFTSRQTADEMLLEQYLKHTRAVEEEIQDLIFEAQELLRILQNLDDRLDVIAMIALRDGFAAQGSKDELFAALWTKLGGNRSSVHKLNEQLKLLKQVSQYRKMAWAHVSTTILKLQAIAAGLEDLRERVAAPEVVGTSKDTPLEMHIESIQLGVERLEAQRSEARKLEGDNYRRVLDRAERNLGEDRMIDGGKVRTGLGIHL
ncbi:hypothetical protein H2201_001392 [Coniosporium apollinis]|uniref:Uncharacterized protein n=1 Tax=Coniosporium apollinis TaxID=61459 RepID=A0ABQ9P468_9PEZI|nr:hypothetical protein H2201_001392 [Coniosporium apollinis]